jgi:hypothetical protein
MENGKDASSEKYIDVRYNLIYSILMILFGIAFVVWALWPDQDAFDKYYFLIFGLLLLVQGLYAISGGRYFRYKPIDKKIVFIGLFVLISRSVKFDKLFFRGKELYRVINGKARYINLLRYQCNKKDLENLFQEINKG